MDEGCQTGSSAAQRNRQRIKRFACPAAIEVSTIAQQYEDAINKVNALNENSSQEEVQTARALGDFIRGKVARWRTSNGRSSTETLWRSYGRKW